MSTTAYSSEDLQVGDVVYLGLQNLRAAGDGSDRYRFVSATPLITIPGWRTEIIRGPIDQQKVFASDRAAGKARIIEDLGTTGTIPDGLSSAHRRLYRVRPVSDSVPATTSR